MVSIKNCTHSAFEHPNGAVPSGAPYERTNRCTGKSRILKLSGWDKNVYMLLV